MSFPRAVALAAICWSLPSAATAAAERHALTLPAGSLGDALAALGRQARISIGVSDSSLASERVRAVSGRMSVEQALAQLLRGKPARATFIDSHTVRIVRLAPARPPPPRQAPARVQAPDPPALAIERPRPREPAPDIIVTASRRSVPLADYPGSVAILSGDDPFLGAEIGGSEALVAQLPAITSTHLGPGRNKLFVRGISDSSFNGPTQATVGQYLGEMRVNYNAPDPDLRLYDVGRIELLSGPQGTLYGAGSLGGILRVVPNPAELDRTSGQVSLGASATEHGNIGGEAAATLNAPLVAGRLGLRVSGYAISEGGYIDNTLRQEEDVNDVRIFGGRAALRFQPDDHWTLDAEAVGQSIRGDDAQFAESGQPPLTRQSTVTQNFKNDYLLGGLVAAREWDDFRFVGSASTVRQQLFERFDATRAGNPPAAYDLHTGVSLLSAEGRLSRELAGGASWLLGAAFLSNDLKQKRVVDLFYRSSVRNRVTNKVVEAAAYGEASAPIAPGIIATLGARVSGARLSSSGFAIDPSLPRPGEPVRASRTNLRILPSAALAMQAAENLLLYARYQQSFRPGGLAISGAGFNRFASDSLAAVEVGARYGVPDRSAFVASAALAYAGWKNVQADSLDVFAEPTTTNIGDARLFTLDASARWLPLAGLALDAGLVLNRSTVRNVPLGVIAGGGRQLPGVAAVNARLALDYAFAGPLGTRMRASLAGRYTGPSRLGVGEFFRREQGDWLDTHAILRAEAGRNAFTLSVTNLFDTRADRFAFGSPFTLDQKEFETPMRPRTVTLRWELLY